MKRKMYCYFYLVFYSILKCAKLKISAKTLFKFLSDLSYIFIFTKNNELWKETVSSFHNYQNETGSEKLM